MNAARFRTVFQRLVCVILILTSMLKVLAACGSAEVLFQREALTGLVDNRQFLVIGGLIELTVVVILCARFSQQIKLLSILWLGCTFLTYRLALWMTDISSPCPCLGYYWEWLSVEPAAMEIGLKSVIAGMIVGSICSLIASSRASTPTS